MTELNGGSLDSDKMRANLDFREGYEKGYEKGAEDAQIKLQETVDRYYKDCLECIESYNHLATQYDNLQKGHDLLVVEGREMIAHYKNKKDKYKKENLTLKRELEKLQNQLTK